MIRFVKSSFIVFSFCIPFTYAQSDFYIQNFTIKNGLPENNILGLYFDKEGYLWNVYGSGVTRFDGLNFKKYFTSEVPYISFYLNQTTDGQRYLVDASGYIFHVNGLKLDTLRAGKVNSLNYLNIKGILPDIQTYFSLTTPHINKAVDKSWIFSPVILFPDSAGSYIVRTRKGIAQFKGNTKIKELLIEPFQNSSMITANGHIYVFANKKEFYRLDINKWQLIPCTMAGDLSQVENIAEQISNTFWNFNNSDPCIQIAFQLYDFIPSATNPDSVFSKLITDKLPDNCLISSVVYIQDQKLIMVGTDTRGLFVFKEKQFKSLQYKNPEPETNNTYFCQIALDSNTILTDWNREFTINGGKPSRFNLNRNYSENIYRDKKGFFWFVEGNTLVKYNPVSKQKKIIYNPSRELVLSYFEEGDSLWVGMSQSFGCVVNDSVKYLKKLDNNQSNSNILQLARWENKLWICNYTGMYRYDSMTDRLDTIPELSLKYPYNFQTTGEYMLIGTYGRGYYLLHKNKTLRMPSYRFDALKQVHSFVPDTIGQIWMATNNGIFKARFSDMKSYFEDTTHSIPYIHYTEEDGIVNPEFNGGCDPTYIRLKNG